VPAPARVPGRDAPDCAAARVVADHPGQGWSLLCNGAVLFEDGGALLADGQAVAPPNVGSAPRSRRSCQGRHDKDGGWWVTQGRRGKTGLCAPTVAGKPARLRRSTRSRSARMGCAGLVGPAGPGTRQPGPRRHRRRCRHRYRPAAARHRQTARRRRTRDRREGRHAMNTGCPARSTGTAWPAIGDVVARHGLCGESTDSWDSC